ncbi:hypothetical protein WPS_09920 [Vulcanimicrobium alpinum]|uniref:Uncharacterized protein n=1 Tax=Vulcanimicrobium alpinum TaxID=3016050 RepID=A0AAN1XUG2_UNVUL|nr:hypothetical protein [Vulcanimicrobium alpinum]BDE05716.1 hypothetical protein WPS_09920 [Vulcanimicrobium alpinum]
MNGTDERTKLPVTVGGLVDLAFIAYVERFWLYALLVVAAFAIETIVEFAIPSAKLESPQGQIKLLILDYLSTALDAYVIAAVALGIGARLAGERPTWPVLMAGALERWLPVFLVGLVAYLMQWLLNGFDGFGTLPEPPWIAFFTAPVAWLIFGVLAIAAPMAALSGEPRGGAMFAGISRAFSFSSRRANLGRLALVSFATIVPGLLQHLWLQWLLAHHVARAPFLSAAPLDALFVAPLAALQTVFALDFARRSGSLGTPRR